jgi:hypothetical protein
MKKVTARARVPAAEARIGVPVARDAQRTDTRRESGT